MFILRLTRISVLSGLDSDDAQCKQTKIKGIFTPRRSIRRVKIVLAIIHSTGYSGWYNQNSGAGSNSYAVGIVHIKFYNFLRGNLFAIDDSDKSTCQTCGGGAEPRFKTAPLSFVVRDAGTSVTVDAMQHPQGNAKFGISLGACRSSVSLSFQLLFHLYNLREHGRPGFGWLLEAFATQGFLSAPCLTGCHRHIVPKHGNKTRASRCCSPRT
jgi:hypothetical protein